MLDLEITPDKSISSEKWQIILGNNSYWLNFYNLFQFKFLNRDVSLSSNTNTQIKL